MNVVIEGSRDTINKLNEFGKQAPKMLAHAINRTGTGSVTGSGTGGLITTIAREVAAILNLTQSFIKSKGITYDKATITDTSAAVHVSGKPIPIIQFSNVRLESSKAKSIIVRIKKSTGSQRLSHAFVVKTKSNHRGVFTRVKSGAGYVGRYPIKEIYTSSIPEVLGDDPVLDKVTIDLSDKLDANIEHEIDYELSRLQK